MTPPYRQWQARQRRAVKLYRRGVAPPDIARRLRVGDQTVYRYLRDADVGLSQPARRLPNVWPERRPPYWGLHARLGSFEVVCGRKFCAGCGKWRHLCDFPHDTHKGGVALSRCRACSARTRRYYFERETPEQVADRRERHRIYYEGKRREAGVPVTTAKRRTAIDNREAIYLPVEPLRAALKPYEGGELTALAARAGVPERTVTRIRHESRKVQIDVADKLAVALGVPSATIWGERW